MMPWTKLEDTDLWDVAREQYARNNHAYHNFDHVFRMYEHAQALGMEHDIHLDRAILTHDVLDDERASMRWLDEALGQSDPAAGAMIEATMAHRPGPGDNRLILLDLADFRDDDVRRRNTELLRREAFESRGVGDQDFVARTITYLEGLENRILEGIPLVPDRREQTLWHEIRDGILATLAELRPIAQEIYPVMPE